MAFRHTRALIGVLWTDLNTAVHISRSAFKLFSRHPGLCSPAADVLTGSHCRCNMATSVTAQPRSAEEKKSRKAAREEAMAAHQQYPFLPTKPSRQVYVLHKGLAKEIAASVIKNQSNPSTPILEANPGPGVVTRALLKAGARRMILMESTKAFMPDVQAMQETYRTHIMAAYNLDYLSAWLRAGEADSPIMQFEENMTTLLPHRPWAEGPPVSVVVMLPEQKEKPFLKHLIMAHSQHQSFFSLGRPEWFMAVSPALYTKLLAVKMEKPPLLYYSHLAIVLHLLFDIHLCAQLPGWKFTPHFPEKKPTARAQNAPQVSKGMRYLLRLRPHVTQVLPPGDVPAFHGFLAQLMQKKKLRLIPKMEQLVPGCGPHLIKMEVTMMSLVADISPNHFLAIFKAMFTWPEYQASPLKQLLSSTVVPTAEEDSVDDTHTQKADREQQH